jgi:8-oxo-dGTP pyrophosphatase MutT (NUDIX family)
MKRLLELIEEDFNPNLEIVNRTAVRGIIFVDGLLLMIKTNHQEVKFPGGGAYPHENFTETLCREVLEETGYHVKPHSIKPFGDVLERRKSLYENKIWNHISQYFFCEIDSSRKEETNLSIQEKKHDMKGVFLSIDEAININEHALKTNNNLPWTKREFLVLKILKDYNLNKTE